MGPNFIYGTGLLKFGRKMLTTESDILYARINIESTELERARREVNNNKNCANDLLLSVQRLSLQDPDRVPHANFPSPLRRGVHPKTQGHPVISLLKPEK